MYPNPRGLPTIGIRPRILDTKVKSMMRSSRARALTSQAIGLVDLPAIVEEDAWGAEGEG
jgi:hypothetical protein